MQLEERILAFSQLGVYIEEMTHPSQTHEILERARQHNGWFTTDNSTFALKGWAKLLKKDALMEWLAPYSLNPSETKEIAVIMAGNVPLVGFHDFISVLISGHKVKAKLSTNDAILLPHLADKLIEIDSRFQDRIEFPKGQLKDFDAVIATGSDNTARHFDYYFGQYPNIIRKNRNGVAVLTGNENDAALFALSNDIFRYFGLGCRNVSKIFIPKRYDFNPFFKAMFHWKDLINNDKYINNYDYNKAVYLMSDIDLLDNEFMLLKEDSNYASPISVVFYEYYDSMNQLQERLVQEQEHIQCVVSEAGIEGQIPFGTAQTPALSQYADGVDTLAFLSGL